MNGMFIGQMYINVFYYQVITSIPTHHLPHMFSCGSATPEEIEMIEKAMDEDQVDANQMGDDMGKRGQILWIRGLTRLQHQVRNYFIQHSLILAFMFSFMRYTASINLRSNV